MPGISQHFEQFLARTMAQAAENVTNALYMNNPFATGLSRSSWIPSIGELQDVSISEVSVQRSKQLTGIASLAGYSLRQGDILITNAVPYVIFLDQGHSAQAPMGFVRQSITQGLGRAVRLAP